MLPKYEIIKQDIIKMIESGEFSPEDKIYSEGDLKKMYSVSNTTVVKALNDLVSDGYLIRRQGEGTFVRKNLKHRKVLFTECTPGHAVDQQVVEELVEKTVTLIGQTIHCPKISEDLGDHEGTEDIIKISQIALINEKPWKIQNRYVLAKYLDVTALGRLKNGASLSRELNLSNNMAMLPMKMSVNIKTVDHDSEILEPLREINRNFEFETTISLFEITKITYDPKGEPVEVTKSYIHPDYYSIEILAD